MEWLDTNIVYWHWVALGLLLVLLELTIPVFVIMWLGVAGITIGLLMLVFPLNFTMQILLWMKLSLIYIGLWHLFISPRLGNKTMAGLSREAIIGQVGLTLHFNGETRRGRLRFSAPILGNDEWDFIYNHHTEQPLNNGDKVVVLDISGNSLLVKHA